MRSTYFVWKTGAVLLAFGTLLLASSATSFAKDNDREDSQSSANDRSDQRDRQNRDDQDRDRDQNRDQEAQHHAALGVSIDDSSGHPRVIAVLPGSPAARSGIQINDEIRSVDDDNVRTAQGLIDEIGDYKPGSKVELSIRRNGERQKIHVRLASRENTYAHGSRNRMNSDQTYRGQNNNWSGYQNNWGGRRASYDNQQNFNRDQNQLLQQVRSLQHQVDQLQQQVNQLRGGNSNYRTSYRGDREQSRYDGYQNDRDRDDDDIDASDD